METMLWWILGTAWSVLTWVVLYIAQYLFAPVFFILGWVSFISILVYAYWLFKYGFTAATTKALEGGRTASVWVWSTAQRVLWFIRGVHATQSPHTPARTVQKLVYVKRSFTRKLIGASWWMIVGGFVVNEWHAPGTLWPLMKSAFAQVMRLWA